MEYQNVLSNMRQSTESRHFICEVNSEQKSIKGRVRQGRKAG